MEEFPQDGFKKGVKVILIKRFVFGNEAYLAAASLKAEGIDCFVSNSNLGTLVPFSEGAFTLHINEDDAEHAREVLRRFENPTSEEADFREADLEDIAYEKEVREQEAIVEEASPNIAFYIFAALIIASLLILALKNKL